VISRATEDHDDRAPAVGCIGIPLLIIAIGIAACAWSQVFA
jgi:hypothetical protein